MGEVLDFGKHFEKRRKEKEAADNKPVDGIIHQDNVVHLPEEHTKIDRTSERIISDDEALDIARELTRYKREDLYHFFLQENSRKDTFESKQEFEAVIEAKRTNLQEWSDEQLKTDLHEYREDMKSYLNELEIPLQHQETLSQPKFNAIHIACVAQEYYLRKHP